MLKLFSHFIQCSVIFTHNGETGQASLGCVNIDINIKSTFTQNNITFYTNVSVIDVHPTV